MTENQKIKAADCNAKYSVLRASPQPLREHFHQRMLLNFVNEINKRQPHFCNTILL